MKTKLTLENFKITKEYDGTKMVFLAENVDILNWKKVVFSGFKSDDVFSLPYPLENIDTVSYMFDDVTFY